MISYRLFGLTVACNLPISELSSLSVEAPVDVTVRFLKPPITAARTATPMPIDAEGGLNAPVWSNRYISYYRANSGKNHTLQFNDGVKALITADGVDVRLGWPANMAFADVVRYLVFIVLPAVQRVQGGIRLHSAVLAVDGQGVALVGTSAVGKSTLTATLAARKCAVLTDDLAVLEHRGRDVFVHPGYPWLCLRPDMAHKLAAEEMLPVTTGQPWCQMGETFVDCDLSANGFAYQKQPIKLAAIYFLDSLHGHPAGYSFEDVPGDIALLELIPRAEGASLLLLDETALRAMRARQFVLFGDMVQFLPIRRLRVKWQDVSLQRLCDALLLDFATVVDDLGSSAPPK